MDAAEVVWGWWWYGGGARAGDMEVICPARRPLCNDRRCVEKPSFSSAWKESLPSRFAHRQTDL